LNRKRPAAVCLEAMESRIMLTGGPVVPHDFLNFLHHGCSLHNAPQQYEIKAKGGNGGDATQPVKGSATVKYPAEPQHTTGWVYQPWTVVDEKLQGDFSVQTVHIVTTVTDMKGKIVGVSTTDIAEWAPVLEGTKKGLDGKQVNAHEAVTIDVINIPTAEDATDMVAWAGALKVFNGDYQVTTVATYEQKIYDAAPTVVLEKTGDHKLTSAPASAAIGFGGEQIAHRAVVIYNPATGNVADSAYKNQSKVDNKANPTLQYIGIEPNGPVLVTTSHVDTFNGAFKNQKFSAVSGSIRYTLPGTPAERAEAEKAADKSF